MKLIAMNEFVCEVFHLKWFSWTVNVVLFIRSKLSVGSQTTNPGKVHSCGKNWTCRHIMRVYVCRVRGMDWVWSSASCLSVSAWL